jgi:hypothetical protein
VARGAFDSCTAHHPCFVARENFQQSKRIVSRIGL